MLEMISRGHGEGEQGEKQERVSLTIFTWLLRSVSFLQNQKQMVTLRPLCSSWSPDPGHGVEVGAVSSASQKMQFAGRPQEWPTTLCWPWLHRV